MTRKSAGSGPSRAVSPASPRQRAKVKHEPCLVCGVESFQAKIDPAHLCPRSHGGCDSRFCVVPLCRLCHRAFDDGRLDILPSLRPFGAFRRFGLEIVHALAHYDFDLIALLHRLTGQRWSAPVESDLFASTA